MPRVIYVLQDGSRREVEVPQGASAMLGAVQNGVSGIVAECGGGCACATCHVYVDPGSLALLPEKGTLEDDLLDAVAAERRDNSRLSCQIRITPEMDGKLVLHIPECQV